MANHTHSRWYDRSPLTSMHLALRAANILTPDPSVHRHPSQQVLAVPGPPPGPAQNHPNPRRLLGRPEAGQEEVVVAPGGRGLVAVLPQSPGEQVIRHGVRLAGLLFIRRRRVLFLVVRPHRQLPDPGGRGGVDGVVTAAARWWWWWWWGGDGETHRSQSFAVVGWGIHMPATHLWSGECIRAPPPPTRAACCSAGQRRRARSILLSAL